ncbi:glycosyltransferase family 2 protein [Virgibacillus alimentarius]|uniref:glycosyltransferase family 2 protein n=1 Tax=Virgibacillus alimentarius TaxID=698769 RepID=UPI0004938214|nr:glycosyltransferase family 2 protein [Virgibacillus alimentarius]
MQSNETAGPLISVITPAYNSQQFIHETIESVQNQTYTNWEMIIVDDCSTDKTTEIVASYQKEDARITLIKLKENAGSGVARNTAIEAAKGRFIAFLDSDDVWLETKLEKQLDFMLEKDIAFSFTEYVRMLEDGTEVNSVIKAPETIDYVGLMKHCVIGCLTVMLDTKKTGKVKMIHIRSRQDYVLWLTLTKNGFTAYGLPEVLSKYRLVQNSISSNKLKMVKQNWRVYRTVEEQSAIKSAWYILNYAFHYIKRRFNRRK